MFTRSVLAVSCQRLELWAGQIYHNITKLVVYVKSNGTGVAFSGVLLPVWRHSSSGAIFKDGSGERFKLLKQNCEPIEILHLIKLKSR